MFTRRKPYWAFLSYINYWDDELLNSPYAKKNVCASHTVKTSVSLVESQNKNAFCVELMRSLGGDFTKGFLFIFVLASFVKHLIGQELNL